MALSKSELFNAALGSLILANRSGVIALLNKYGYPVAANASTNTIVVALLKAMSVSSAFTNDVLSLLKAQANKAVSNATGNDGGSDTSDIIAAALKAIGMITSTWQNTALISANSDIAVAKINANATDDAAKTNANALKGNAGIIIVIIAAGAIMLGLMAFVLIKTSKK